MTEDDVDLVVDWLGREHVRTWWGEPMTAAEVAAKYVPRIRGDVATEMFIVTEDGADIGVIQRYRAADHPDFGASFAHAGIDATDAAGIDYLIGATDQVGRGIGSAMISAFTARLFADLPDIAAIIVTPQAANVASCRVLEKAGYERRWVGMLDSDDPSDAGEAALYVRRRP